MMGIAPIGRAFFLGEEKNMWLYLLAMIVGLSVLVYSADVFIDGASHLAKKFHVPKVIIGMFIIGVGTSAPEMVVSVLSAMEGSSGLALGNAYGSNVVNITLVLGLTAAISPLFIQPTVIKKDFIWLFAITALALWQLWDKQLSRFEGFILLFVLSVLLTQQFIEARKSAKDSAAALAEEELSQLQEIKIPLALAKLTGGLIALIISSRLIVWGAVELAQLWGLSELIIGLTIVAIGTSLPELVSSVMAARRGEHEMALGNVIGSNIFNTLAVVGLASAISPFNIAPEILHRDIFVMVALTVLLFVLCLWALRNGGRMDRSAGAILTASFIAYTLWLLHDALT